MSADTVPHRTMRLGIHMLGRIRESAMLGIISHRILKLYRVHLLGWYLKYDISKLEDDNAKKVLI
jgi:hypothetical protein